jgi:phosphoserine phosphatase RsbU/P
MKILIAEDDATSRLILSATLKKLGHEVVEASEGHTAWTTFKQTPFAVVITDWMMPKMDGVDLCRAIRELPRKDYTYILILTSLSGKGRFLEGMDAGADDYVTKPFDPDELAARLRVAARILGLEQRVVRLEGLLPICSYCKKIRDDDNKWTQMEQYVASRSDASFSHSICPHCYETRVESEIAAFNAAKH